MDVQALELSIDLPRGRRPARPGSARGRDIATRPRKQPGPGEVATREAGLYAYTAASIVAGLGALLWSTTNVPIWPAIDPGLPGTALAGPDGGLLLWMAFGLIGSLRVLQLPGSSGVWTFHFPFIAAAMVLGGPTAGAWVGFLSTIERRELSSQPWYGVLANHAVMAFAAVLGGLTVQAARGALVASGADPGVAGLIATAAGTIVLAGVANAVAAGTIVLREQLRMASLADMLIRSIGRMTMAEVSLAWVFVVAFTAAGWWAPLAIALVVLVVWPAEGIEFPDPLTKLPRLRSFERELDRVIAWTRRGLAGGGLLLWMDLNDFGTLNKMHGQHVGDEVLAEVGVRIRAAIRATDFAARRGGDELAMFFANVVDADTARDIAGRVEVTIRQPILTSAGALAVGVSIGAIIVRPSAEIPDRPVLTKWADRTMQAVKADQRAGRSDSGVRFHEYGRAGIGAADGLDRGDRAPMPDRARGGRLLFGVLVAAGATVLTLAAVLARLAG